MRVVGKVASIAGASGLAFFGLFGLVGSASPAQGASGTATSSGTATYSATVTIPAPPASNFTASAGGDGWGLAMTPTAVYNVFHHDNVLVVACHLQVNAQDCWTGPKTITDQGGSDFATSGQPGLYLDQGSGHLFVYATRVASLTAGVVCIDTTQPASNPDPFCGFTALTPDGAAPLQQFISGTSDPVLINSEWFAFNYVTGAAIGSGGENALLCFNVSTDTPCANQPYGVNLGSGKMLDGGFPSPSIADFADQIVVSADTTDNTNGILGCITAALASCGGSWPVSLSNGYPALYGTAFPLLSAAGQTTGFCLPAPQVPCYDLSGASVATPVNLATTVQPSDGWNGAALVLGPRVYLPNGTFNPGSGDSAVECFDYSTGQSCPNFPKVFADTSILDYLYTVNPDPQRPSCIWVNSDGGETGQIQNFDAYTGGPCGQGAIRLLSSALVVPQVQCQPANFTSLQLLTPPPNQYANATVEFDNNDATPIPGIPVQTLDPTGFINLAPFNLTTKAPLPQFVISIQNPSTPVAQAVVKIVWTGANDPSCAGTGVTFIPPAQTAPGQSPPGIMMLGGDGGFFAYGGLGFVGAANFWGQPGPDTTPSGVQIPTTFSGLAAAPGHSGYWGVLRDGQVLTVGTAANYGDLRSTHLRAPIVGMAATPSGLGYWLVGADGGVFRFGDAPYLGSLGAAHLAAPIVAIMGSPTGRGYTLVGADGGVFTFGDARYFGSLGGARLRSPITAAVATGDDRGYLLAGGDGGVFAFGTAPFRGSLSGIRLRGPVVAISLTPSGQGYWEVGSDGGLFTFGDAPFLLTGHSGVNGSLPQLAPSLRAPIVAATS